MLNKHPRFPFKGVVIIADLLTDDEMTSVHLRRDLERTELRTLRVICDAVMNIGFPFYHYEHPKDLAKHAAQHTDDVVLSIYGGAASRSRMALVPAICETFGLSYVGPDAYGRIICQDKEVSKSLASTAGLATAQHRIIRDVADITSVSDFPLPYVAKPLLEGSSIGIGTDNLITDRSRGEIVLQEMIEHFHQPIMVESFVPGREVSWCFIETPGEDRTRSFAEIVWENEPDHFDRNLYDAPHKLSSEGKKAVQVITNELQKRDIDALEYLLQLIGPMGYGRIDGKFRNGEFVFLEMTPDAWLGPTGTFASSFIGAGLPYEEVIARVLLSARPGLPNQ